MGRTKKSATECTRYSSSDQKGDRIFLLCGPLAMILYLIFLITAGFLPPISPAATANDVEAHYSHHEWGMKWGISLLAVAALLWPLYGVSIHHQLSRIPNVSNAALLLQLVNSSAAGIIFSLVPMFFAAGAYRQHRNPEITQLANDLAWFCWSFGGGPLILQFYAVSWAIGCDSRPQPLIPQWVAWIALAFPVGMLFPFATHHTYSGPLAWDGVVSFWGLWETGAMSVGPVTYYIWRATGVVDG